MVREALERPPSSGNGEWIGLVFRLPHSAHIESINHVYLYEELPRLAELLDKMVELEEGLGAG
ncbi:MAG: hypothetical protein N2037_10370 [Acidimicrobiales bacterium]|nr:hypothetical protein [Acidimicrobiales bacterium]